jgi:hypothetical protein
MGQSTPTTTMAIDTFEARYAAYRAELHPREQAWFDELVCRARRHSSAINRRPHLDFERPVMLSMLLEGMRELDECRLECDGLRRDVLEMRRVLEGAGLVARRPDAAAATMQAGQTVLVEA